MRRRLYDTTAKFMVRNDLLAAAAAKAEREGVTLSDVMRGALKRELAQP